MTIFSPYQMTLFMQFRKSVGSHVKETFWTIFFRAFEWHAKYASIFVGVKKRTRFRSFSKNRLFKHHFTGGEGAPVKHFKNRVCAATSLVVFLWQRHLSQPIGTTDRHTINKQKRLRAGC